MAYAYHGKSITHCDFNLISMRQNDPFEYFTCFCVSLLNYIVQLSVKNLTVPGEYGCRATIAAATNQRKWPNTYNELAHLSAFTI